ncbi:MAG: hypothetical protein WC321_05415 [Candidatus Omnitrophota bacterium]|jgi:hypothetical protein
MEKLKYELDPHNRLTATSRALRGIRRVLDGQFKIAGRNSLAYHVKAPLPEGIKAPSQVKLKGNWSLTKERQLRLTLDKWYRQRFGDEVTLQGEIIDAQKNMLLFAVKSRTRQGMPSRYILKLAGAWQADERNRLNFKVDKGQGKFDSLVFEGAWDIDKNYQIIYKLEKEQLTRRRKKIHTLTFKGHWEVKDKTRLSYVIDADSGSGFEFKTSAGVFKNNYIKYELGIGLAHKKRAVKRAIIFFGKWRIRKGAGLVFEAEQGNGRIQAIVFGAEARLTAKDTAAFKLRNSLNKGLGAELELSHDIFKGDGQAFLRLLKAKGESAILAGAGWRW